MDGKGLAILVLLFLITLMLFMPQRSPYTNEPVGATVPTDKPGPMIQQGGDSYIVQGASDTAASMLAPFTEALENIGGSFKVGQVPSDPNVGLIPKEVVTTEDFGQFSADAILSGQNFLDPRAQIGFPETIGGNLRNANLQERSEPPNPRDPVSIFNLSTIPPDTMRPKFEIQNEYKGY
jgi:hypothetical protein